MKKETEFRIIMKKYNVDNSYVANFYKYSDYEVHEYIWLEIIIGFVDNTKELHGFLRSLVKLGILKNWWK